MCVCFSKHKSCHSHIQQSALLHAGVSAINIAVVGRSDAVCHSNIAELLNRSKSVSMYSMFYNLKHRYCALCAWPCAIITYAIIITYL